MLEHKTHKLHQYKRQVQLLLVEQVELETLHLVEAQILKQLILAQVILLQLKQKQLTSAHQVGLVLQLLNLGMIHQTIVQLKRMAQLFKQLFQQ